MKILISGGTGFIGQAFIFNRLMAGDEVYCLTRNPDKVETLFSSQVIPLSELPKPDELEVDAVINLAGEPILDERWSDKRKQLLRSSRIGTTELLVKWISLQRHKPKVLISGSAIGYYGSQLNAELNEELNEDSPCETGFTHQLCADWESAANKAKDYNVRVCTIRTGIVLGDGGALEKMTFPFKLGLGGPIGEGSQWMSWIHIDDEIDIIEMLLTHDTLEGPFNLTAPTAVTNAQFAKALGNALNRPAILPMPTFVMKLMLGEGAELLVEGQKVVPAKLLNIGYKHKYPELKGALASILNT